MNRDIIIIGCNGFVAALDGKSGNEIWRTQLRQGVLGGSRGHDVTVLIDGDTIFAGCYGMIFGISASNGHILWENELKGLGYNEVTLARQGISTQFTTRHVHTHS